jgi:hypothetical protein
MWDYSDRRDSTRISQDELHEAEIDECVRARCHEYQEEVSRAESLRRGGLQQGLSPHRGMLFILIKYFFLTAVLLIKIECDWNFCSGH